MLKKFYLGLIMIIMMMTSACGGTSTESEARIAKLEAQIAELEAQITEPEKQTTEAETQIAEPEKQTTEAEIQIAEPEKQILFYNETANALYHERLADSNRQLLIYDDISEGCGYLIFPTKDGIFDTDEYVLILNDNSVNGKTALLDDHVYTLPYYYIRFIAYDEVSQRLLFHNNQSVLLVFDLSSESTELIHTEAICHQLNKDNPSILSYADLEGIEYSCNWTESSSSSPTGRTGIVQYQYTGTVELLDDDYIWEVDSQNIYDATGNIVLSDIVNYLFDPYNKNYFYLLDNKGTLYYYHKNKGSNFKILAENIICAAPNGVETWPTFLIDETSIYDKELFYTENDFWDAGPVIY